MNEKHVISAVDAIEDARRLLGSEASFRIRTLLQMILNDLNDELRRHRDGT